MKHIRVVLVALVALLIALATADAGPRYSIVRLFTEKSFGTTDSTTSSEFFMWRATRVYIYYSTKNGTSLSGTDSRPMLDVSNDSFESEFANPSLSSHGVNIITGGNGTSIHRTAIITANPVTANGPGMPIPFKFGRVRFGPTATGTDTLNATAIVVWENDDEIEQIGVLVPGCSGSSGAKHLYMPARFRPRSGVPSRVAPGMVAGTSGGVAGIQGRTFVTAVNDTAVFLSRTLNGNLTNQSVWFTW